LKYPNFASEKSHKKIFSNLNEAPRSKLRGIKQNYGAANPSSQARRRQASFAVVRLTNHPCSKLQGILAKPNK
jgi:hypothetical protein